MKMSRILAVCLASATVAFAGPPKIAKDLLRADPNAIVDVIVQFTTVPTAKQHQKMAGYGGVHRAGLDLIKAGLYSLPVHALHALEQIRRSFICLPIVPFPECSIPLLLL